MARIFTQQLLLNPNTDAFKKSIQDMRYNAAAENRNQWTAGIADVAKSLGEVGKAFYEDKKRQDRFDSVDDADFEYRNDPVWVAAKEEYARTGDSSKLNAVKSQFVAQAQAKASQALVEEERNKRLAGVKAKLEGLKAQIDNKEIPTDTRLGYLTQYNTLAAENGLAPYTPSVDKRVSNNIADPNVADSFDYTPSLSQNTITSITNSFDKKEDMNNDGIFDENDIDILMNALDIFNPADVKNSGLLQKLQTAKENIIKDRETKAQKDIEEENKNTINDLKNQKEMLTRKIKDTDKTYSNIDNIKALNVEIDNFNNSLGDNANAVGTIDKIEEPKSPSPQSTRNDVVNWAKSAFSSRITNDSNFIGNNWNDIVETYNSKHQSRPYRGK